MSKLTFNFLSKLKSFLFLLFLFFSSKTIVAQKAPNELFKYSHTQFIDLLTSHKDSVFSLKNAFIYIDELTDHDFYYEKNDDLFEFSSKDTLTINTKIELSNVHFEHIYNDTGYALHHIKFTKPVVIENSASLVFSNCIFEKGFYADVNIPLDSYVSYFEKEFENYGNDFSINESVLKSEFIIDIGTIEVFSPIFVTISKTIFNIYPDLESAFLFNNIRSFDFLDNSFVGNGFVYISNDENWRTQIKYNDFGNTYAIIYQAGISSSSVNHISDNIFRKTVLLEVENFNKTDIYNWNEWQDKIISFKGYDSYIDNLEKNKTSISDSYISLFNNDSILKSYINSHKYKLESAFKYEKRLLGSFYDYYKSQYDTDFANTVYVTLKDLDTKRYQYLNEVEPSFKTFFTWKINQFLKFFSAYGTAPSKTVEISIYVILIFAFIYMFFPNSWDTMNQNRLMKRIRFYTRYFRNKESMKEIYEEERKQDLMTFQEFKDYMHQSKKETPSYFLWLAKPIYYFSSTNYKIISKLFDKTDLLKGKWVDLPKNKKMLTSIFMGIWILFLLIFDLFLKFINALTLSLNTFTTLGFGEIPTKGFPRYLSILQGFIGWFMLSIFSVSLISQILN